MRIRSRLLLSIAGTLTVGAVIMACNHLAMLRVSEGLSTISLYHGLSQRVFELGSLTDKYLAGSSPRVLEQWRSVYRTTGNALKRVQPLQQTESQLLDTLRKRYLELQPLFERLEAVSDGTEEAPPGEDFRERLAAHSSVQIRLMFDDVARLIRDKQSQMELAQQRLTLATTTITILLVLCVCLFLYLTNRKIVRSFVEVLDGTRILRDGNLGHRINILRNDEMGELAQSINLMSETLRERTEDLYKNREWLQVTLTSIGDAVIAADGSGLVSFMNPVAVALTGCEEAQANGRLVSEVFQVIDGRTGKPAEDIFDRVLKHGVAVQRSSASLICRNGLEIPIEDSAAPIVDKRGDILGVVHVFHDVTEERRAREALLESEERFRTMFELASVGMAQLDPATGRWELVNGKLCEILGYAPEELTGMHFLDVTHPEDRRHSMEIFQDALGGAMSQYHIEKRYTHRNGRIVWVSVNIAMIRDHAGKPVRSLTVVEDISERKQAEEQRTRLTQRLQLAQKAESLGRMAGAIAHNFNNMLGAVIGNLDLALDEVSDGSELKVLINEAMSASQRAATISRFMLTYLGQTNAKAEALDPSAVIGETLALLRPSIQRSVRLRAEPSSVTSNVKADGALLAQILANLITNAVEAIGEQEGEIALGLDMARGNEVRKLKLFPVGWEPEAEEYICLSVADTGGGIEQENIDKIFDPFFSTKFPGRGLGLSIVTGLLRSMGGAVTVENHSGLGARFRVFLAVSEQARTAATPKQEFQITGVEKGYRLVLVVDDETFVRNMAESILRRKFGFDVVTACDGPDALKTFQARREEISLVLLDLSMPGMDGWETLSALRALRPDIPVILSSGYDEAHATKGDYLEKPQAFLPKPYGSDALQDAIKAALK